ncbi:helix-turn-helix transcriptional regulator [Curtobacterium flaccumfaciens pv. beticola]|uniref:winged helix-turn-helix transcriptional regulator n=1 Tax=Curtobacterium TaxID=2034 RepID=UPI00254D4B8A|nr:helix-turn-helix domain-containing protein [Curtobacterium citreum]MCS5487119.1 helix-turn-helix transcriptional regulator [Curtobacterium flaccumfaciens pv. basellae]MDK8172454.1 helix-turn-helix domain-containing protein [Curtobacterium citreum]
MDVGIAVPDGTQDTPADGPVRFPTACPTRVVLSHVTSRWGVLVLLALRDGPVRWGELRRTIEGVSEKMLASTLRTFEHDGIVHRDVQPTVPPRVDYSLTGAGQELAERLVPLMDWIVEHADAIVDGR